MNQPKLHFRPVLDRVSGSGWRLLVVALILALFVFAVVQLRFIFLSVMIALLTTSVLAPLRSLLQRHSFGHLWAVWIVMGSGILLLGIIAAAIIVPFALQWQELWTNVTDGLVAVQAWLTTGPFKILESTVDEYVNQIEALVGDNASRIFGGVVNATVLGLEVLFAALLSIPIVFFLLRDSAQLKRWLVSWVPPENRPKAEEVANRAWLHVSAFIRGTTIVATIDAVFIGAALFALGIPLASSLTLLTFIAAFVPIVGALAAGIAAVLVALVSEGAATALIVGVVVIAVQQIEGNLLSPYIIGKVVHLHPLAILFAVTIGSTLAGILGAFTAIPIVIAVYAVASEFKYPVAAPGMESATGTSPQDG